ncbi:MAG: ribosome assembly cofactor RimP [Muribaculaceae bacterium]
MIDKELLTKTVEEAIKDTSIYIVDITISKDNSIIVELDSDDSMDIDMCTSISRKIESVFDRDVEDYELEVGSAGLTSPFKVKRQWQKNIGNEIEVLTKDGRKLIGVLVEVNDDNFVIQFPMKVKEEGKKRPVVVSHKEPITFENCKKACYLIKF